MQIRVFGRVEVAVPDGTLIEVSAPRPRLILAMLASRAGSVVTENALIDAVWGDEQTRSARTALQTYVSALRDTLEPERPRRSPGRFIEHTGTGYRLTVEPTELDIVLFESLVDEARRLHETDRSASVAALDRALDLWEDEPLAEHVDAPWALAVVRGLKELHAAAFESRFGVALDDGTAEGLIDRMERAVARYPYRERLAGQLMLAHYRRGEQQRALQIYAVTRARLLDDLGLDPGRELQLLERAVLAQDPALQTRSGSSTDHDQPATIRASAPMASQLIGREREIADISAMFDTARCVTIVGPGGVGKTSVAANVVEQVGSAFAENVHRVCLSELANGDVGRSIAASMRVVEHPLAPLLDSLADAIGDEPTLLLIETCEVAPEETGRAIASLLRAPGLSVLATSQVPLHLRDEHLVRLAPLTPHDAVDLLVKRSKATGEDVGLLHEIVERVDRLPLGLELAASRLAALGATELLRGLKAGPDLLVGEFDRPPRQRSARAAAEWSLGLLDQRQHDLLARLAAFSASFTITFVQLIGENAETVGADVSELVNRSLVVRIPGESTRFRLPDTVRSVALEHGDPDVLSATRTRIAEVVLESAQAATFGTDAPIDLALAGGEIAPALNRFKELGDHRQLALASMLGMFFTEHGRLSEGREQFQLALDSHPDASILIRLFTTMQLAFLCWYQGDMHATRHLLAELDEMFASKRVPGVEEMVKACASFIDQHYDEAVQYFSVATDILGGATKQRLTLLHMAGNANWYAGRLEAASSCYREQREIARNTGDQFSLAQSLRFEAMTTAALGDIESAWRWSERSLSMSHKMADPVSLAQSSAASAVVALAAGALDDAHTYSVDALKSARRHFDVFALRTTLPIVADAAARAGDPERAARLLGWYLDLLERTGQTPSPASAEVEAVTLAAVRETLGPAGFAKCSAAGAAGRLVDVIALA